MDINSRTRSKTFRITLTQFSLLKNSPRYRSKANPIIRTLLNLYLNKRLSTVDGSDIERLIEIDIEQSLIAQGKGAKAPEPIERDIAKNEHVRISSN
jgi:hypothetical protein